MRRDHAQALDDFESHARRRNLAPPTIKFTLQVARRFVEHLGRKPLAEAGVRDVRRYLARRVVRSVRHELSALRGFLEAVLPANRPLPTDGIASKLLPPRPPVVISHDGVRDLPTQSTPASRTPSYSGGTATSRT